MEKAMWMKINCLHVKKTIICTFWSGYDLTFEQISTLTHSIEIELLFITTEYYKNIND